MLTPTLQNTKTITDMREDAANLLDQVEKSKNPTLVMSRNSLKAVMISPKQYFKFMDLMEDYLDGEIARELEEIPYNPDDYITHEEVLKKLKLNV